MTMQNNLQIYKSFYKIIKDKGILLVLGNMSFLIRITLGFLPNILYDME